ncbi:MAG: hypothetical protein WDM77_01125 [Steroidobacteraceae bacterium]
MEPARLRAILARTPGLTVGHREAWLEGPDSCLIDSDLWWIEANECQIVTALDASFPAGLRHLGAMPATLYVQGSASVLREPRSQWWTHGRRRPPGSISFTYELATFPSATGS